ncbi:MAG TPA: thermostable hemolysin [Halothiobacillus sp.]|nr:thermostable hemolysin [Halothiobacillus sp.]
MLDQNAMFIETGINPLLADLADAMQLQHVDPQHPARRDAQDFITEIFRHAHGAELSVYYPNLLQFSMEGKTRAVVGYRDGNSADLFSAQYFDHPIHEVTSACLGRRVQPQEMVEVGNLAISDPGHARWIISATTAFLAAAGYRWVLFTASLPLVNAFKRLGLKPLPLAVADPNRLPERGSTWGSYYDGQPKVYLGDIHAGLNKLHTVGLKRPNLQNLLRSAHETGTRLGPYPPQTWQVLNDE